MKKVITLLLALVLVLAFAGCSSTQSKIKLFDEACSMMNMMKKLGGGYVTINGKTMSESDIKKLIDQNLKTLGINQSSPGTSSDTRLSIDEEFIETYCQERSVGELFKNIEAICDYYRVDTYWGSEYSHDFEAKYGCSCQKLTGIIMSAIAHLDTPPISFDINVIGKSDFYNNNPEALPKAYVEEVSGSFYNSSGENKSTETRQRHSEVEYYGDFAIAHYYGENYSKGRYGWSGGKFYDELPSWKHYNSYGLYYKGKSIHYYEGNSIDEFYDEIKEIVIISAGEDIYFLSPEYTITDEEGRYSTGRTHTYRYINGL